MSDEGYGVGFCGTHEKACPDCGSLKFVLRTKDGDAPIPVEPPKKSVTITIPNMIKECWGCGRTLADMGDLKIQINVKHQDGCSAKEDS